MQPKMLKALSILIVFTIFFQFSAAGSPPRPPEITVLESDITVTANSAQTSIDLTAAQRRPDGRVSLIVELETPPLGLAPLARTRDFEIESAASAAYLLDLARRQDAAINQMKFLAPSTVVSQRYNAVFNGFSVWINPEETAALFKLDAVKRVYPDRIREILLDSSTEVINAPAYWSDLGGQSKAGDGVRIAIIDTGIDSHNLLFDGTDFVGPPSFPRGYCADFPADSGFQCNDKLIAARFYAPTFDIHPDEVLSPIDIHGHGSHVAGIAVGNPVEINPGAVVPVTMTISGVAPRAYLLAYKAIFTKADGNAGGSDSMLLAAMNDAMLDGADVINNSWGGEDGGDPAESPYSGAIAALNAAGIVVVFAAGNSGPAESTINCPGCLEDVITVGASTADRIFANTLDAVGPGTISENLIGLGALVGTGPTITETIEAAIIYSGAAAPSNTDGCSLFAAGTFSNSIALIPRGDCDFSVKIDNAEAAGAKAVAIFNDEPGFPIVMGSLEGTSIPSVFLSQDQGQILRDWVVSKVSATARIHAQVSAVRNPNWQDKIWESSAVGPNGDPDVLKPDIVAPGVNILSGAAAGDGFQFLQGTSMAAPHVTGAAALLIQKHSDWNTGQVKTALTSTAARQITQPNGISTATPFMMGAGRINLDQARNVGITFSQPSFANGLCSTLCVWQAEIKNEALAWDVRWEAHVTVPTGVDVKVEPSVVVLGLGESQQFTVTADVSDAATDQWHFAEIDWQHETQDYSDAHLPLAVYVVEPVQARLEKAVNQPQILPGETAHYTITLINDAWLTTTFTLRDPIPENASYVDSSATGGLVYDPINKELYGTIELDSARMSIVTGPLHGYIGLSQYTDPEPCPGGDCDEATIALSGFDFSFYGQQVSDLVWGTNGFLQVGSEIANISNPNQDLPDPSEPNNLIAPLWADLDLDGCSLPSFPSAWYRLFASVDNVPYYIFEWENAALKSDPTTCFSFQVWIKTSTDEIWFVYGPQTGAVDTATVGIENPDGSEGYSYYYNGTGSAPLEGTTLKAVTEVDQTLFTYDLLINAEMGEDVINVAEATNVSTSRIIHASVTLNVGKRIYLPAVMR